MCEGSARAENSKRHELRATTHLQHAAHAEALDLAKSVEGDLRQFLHQAAQGSRDEWPCGRRNLRVDEDERE